MAYEKAWTRPLAGVALAVAAALAAAGCTSAPANTSGNSQHSQGVPAVTTAEASQAFASYRAALDQAPDALVTARRREPHASGQFLVRQPRIVREGSQNLAIRLVERSIFHLYSVICSLDRMPHRTVF